MRLLILFFLLGQVSFSQRDYFVIRGAVKDQGQPDKRIYAMKVRVSSNDSIFDETICDSSGNYSFKIFRRIAPGETITVTVKQDLSSLAKLFPASKKCPALHRPADQYFTDSEIRIIEYKENTDFVADFALRKVMVDYRMPCICFDRNSTKLLKCCGDDPDTTIYCLANILFENPTIIMEVSGKTWKERNRGQLSVQRAELVKQKWISLGIDEQRIIIAPEKYEEQNVPTKRIRQAKSKNEKQELKSQNRTIRYKIIAFDYDPGLKRRVQDHE